MKLDAPAKIFLAIFVLALVIRLPGLAHTASIDEVSYLERGYFLNWHPPIPILAHSVTRMMLGDYAWVSRLLMLAIGMINLTLVYKLASRLCGRRAGLFAAALMGFSAYAVLASLQIDMDGSFLLMFYLSTSLIFLKYLDQKTTGWLLLAGVSFGLCLLTKYPGAFILPILALYHLITEKDLASAIKVSAVILAVGLLVFSLFPLWSYLAGSSYFTDTLGHLSKYTAGRNISLPLMVVQYLLFVLWAGPLLLGLFTLSLFRPKKGYVFAIIWILAIVGFYTFVNRDNFKPIERYFTVLLAPLCIIIGSYLSRLRLSKKEVWLTAAIAVAGLGCFMLLNLRGDMISFYPKTAFIDNALSLRWNFYMPITGSSGPIGFFVNFRVVAIAFIVVLASGLALLAAGQERRRAAASAALIIFLSVSLAYNFFFVQEYLFSTTSPSVNRVTQEMIGYAKANGLPEPIYVFRNTALKYYLRDKYTNLNFIDFDIEDNQTRVEDIISRKATVLIVDFPKLNEQSLFWKGLGACRLEKSFTDKGFAMGRIYLC